MPVVPYYTKLELADILSHGSPVTLFHIEAHSLTFSKGLESGSIYRGVVDKYVRALILLNETIALLLTKPFYSSFCQSHDLLSKIVRNDPKLQVVTLTKEMVLQSKTDPRILPGH